MRIRRIALILLATATGLWAVAGAATPVGSGPDPQRAATPASLKPEAMNALVQKLDPEQVKALGGLMDLLGRSADAAALKAAVAEPGAAELLSASFDAFKASVLSQLTALPEVLRGVWASAAAVFAGRSTSETLLFLGAAILAIVIGALAEWLFNRLTIRRRETIRRARPETMRATVRTLALRAALDLGGVLVFVAAALVANRLLVSDATDRSLLAAFLLQAILIVRTAAALMRFILAPNQPDLRLVSADTRTAQVMARGIVAVTGFVGAAFFAAELMERNGLQLTDSLRFWAALIVSASLIYVIGASRRGLSSILIGEEKVLTPGLQRMAAWWPGITMLVIAANWVLIQYVLSTGYASLTPARGTLALSLIVLAPFFDTVIRGIATHLVPPMTGEGPVAEAAHSEARHSYVRIGRVALLTVLVLAVGKLWGLSLSTLAESGLGAKLAANAVGFLLTAGVGYIAWEVLNLWVNRRLSNDVQGAADDPAGAALRARGPSRLSTVLPIVHMTLQVTIITLTVLLCLAQLGVNITPLLAGAGVFGLAIGFGAQTLVKDIVSGVFFLMDDAFRVGEFIEVGGTTGTVEKISIRSLQLRGATGPVHIVPYGTMSKLTNLSRDWVVMKLKFTVPFDTDLDKVRKIFKKIGREIQEMPEHAANLIAPFKSQGAGDVTDVGIVVRGKFTAKPGTQFPMRKEIYTRVQKAFRESGIEFARREVRVKMPDLAEDAATGAQARAAASASASQAVALALGGDLPGKG